MITVVAAEVITGMLAARAAGTAAVAGIVACTGRVAAARLVAAYDTATDAQRIIADALLGWAEAVARDGDADGSTIIGSVAEYDRCVAGRTKLDALQGKLARLVRQMNAATGGQLRNLSFDAECRRA